MNRLNIILLLMISLSYASFEEVLEGYYQASIDEDYNKYISYIDTSGWNSSDHELMESIVKGIWENYDIESYSINNLEYEQGENYTLATYDLESKITGAENINISLKYITLFHRVGNEWKIVYNMPLTDYLNFTDSMSYIIAYKKTAEIEINEPSNPATILIDNEEPQNLENELERDLNYCITDEYCRENGLGDKCINERCIIEPPLNEGYGICAITPMLIFISGVMIVGIGSEKEEI